MKRIVSKNPLFFSFLFPALVDGTITLAGQDSSYWTNRVVNEASPAYFALLISPWLFVFGSVIWFVFLYWLFKRLKEPFGLFLMFLFIAGHSWGSGSWIWRMIRLGGIYTVDNQISVMAAWCTMILYFAIVAVFATYCLRLYLKKDRF